MGVKAHGELKNVKSKKIKNIYFIDKMAKNLVKLVSRCFILFVCFSFNFNVNCWESYELDLFDLVEEINQNFYEFLGVSKV